MFYWEYLNRQLNIEHQREFSSSVLDFLRFCYYIIITKFSVYIENLKKINQNQKNINIIIVIIDF